MDWEEGRHPRDSAGKFTVKHAVHEIPVHDRHGKHLHTLKRCNHCGYIYGKPANHKGRVTCPTCGEDPERVLHLR